MTFLSPVLWGLARGRIRNDNPDKGTETSLAVKEHTIYIIVIRNDNPDKGTETKRDLCKST